MTRQIGVPCMIFRGGTSKGPYFKLSDLPADPAMRDRFLLAAMGSPDRRQIDGLGGADTLTSKVAIVSPSQRPDADVDYLFAQVSVDKPIVDIEPSCGNMLSGVGPFAIESGMVKATDGETKVVIYNVNTKSRIEATIRTPGGEIQREVAVRLEEPELAHPVPGHAARRSQRHRPVGELHSRIGHVEVRREH